MSNAIHIIKLVEHRKPPTGKDDRSMIDSEGRKETSDPVKERGKDEEKIHISERLATVSAGTSGYHRIAAVFLFSDDGNYSGI